MMYLGERTVLAAAEYKDVKAMPDSTFVRMRWVMCNKGFLEMPDVRARLVACEAAKDKQPASYANTPLLESKKALFSRQAAQRIQGGKLLASSLIDTKKAKCDGVPQRNRFMDQMLPVSYR